jgi:hypothetical protein
MRPHWEPDERSRRRPGYRTACPMADATPKRHPPQAEIQGLKERTGWGTSPTIVPVGRPMQGLLQMRLCCANTWRQIARHRHLAPCDLRSDRFGRTWPSRPPRQRRRPPRQRSAAGARQARSADRREHRRERLSNVPSRLQILLTETALPQRPATLPVNEGVRERQVLGRVR